MDSGGDFGSRTGGVIVCVAFSVFAVMLLVQIAVFEKCRRRYRKRLDEGYYFVEENWVRNRRHLRAVHPNNVDLTGATARIINPALIMD